MPTMTGSIWAQNVGWRKIGSSEAVVDTVTFHLNARNITADGALASVFDGRGSGFWAECGFSEVFTFQGGPEAFDPPLPRLVRQGVTRLTFKTAAVRCFVHSRWVINFWD